MNRHGYKVRKFGREKDQREALIKGLAEQLIINESIETTLSKAKATAQYTEKLITKAKKAQKDLHSRRQVIQKLQTLNAAHKLVDELSPKLSNRNSGHLRVKKTGLRRGDGTTMATVSFVDDLKGSKTAKSANKAADKPEEDKVEAEKAKTSQAASQPVRQSNNQPKQVAQASKRTGRRGNR